MRHFALVPAAGFGQRFGGEVPKQYALLSGQPMLVHTVAALLAFDAFETVWVVVAPQDTLAATVLASALKVHGQRLRIAYVGGASRADTVHNGLGALLSEIDSKASSQPCRVWVHDAARPGIAQAQLHALMDELNDTSSASASGALLAMPVADTLKRVAEGHIKSTVEREGVWQAQTPQCFDPHQLLQALEYAQAQGLLITDEASAMQAIGVKSAVVHGSPHNFKVTTAHDAQLMETLLKQTQSAHPATSPAIAIGEGMDVHALVPGRPLILGGVTVPHHSGLLGHSDADALLHAITDALLGAAGLGDIGRMFPDTDAAYAGADSQVLLKKAYAAVAQMGWRVSNIDATVVAQAPKLAAHIPAMQAHIAACVQTTAQQVNVKAKTNEHLGWLGRQEGIEARAVVLLQRG